MDLAQKLAEYEGIDLSKGATSANWVRYIRVETTSDTDHSARVALMRADSSNEDGHYLWNGTMKQLKEKGACTTYSLPILIRVRDGSSPTCEMVIHSRDGRWKFRVPNNSGFMSDITVTSSSR